MAQHVVEKTQPKAADFLVTTNKYFFHENIWYIYKWENIQILSGKSTGEVIFSWELGAAQFLLSHSKH